jgi:hypothetical protein
MFSLIDRIGQLYKPLADRKRAYGVYPKGNGNFQIRAVGDDDVFVVADNIPSSMVAELIVELLNVVAGVAGNAKPKATNDGWLDRLISHAENRN